jgi:hypothetical protein
LLGREFQVVLDDAPFAVPASAILAKYVPIDRAVIGKMTRVSSATRLRPAMAQPWIDAVAEFGVIPASFAAIDLVK